MKGVGCDDMVHRIENQGQDDTIERLAQIFYFNLDASDFY